MGNPLDDKVVEDARVQATDGRVGAVGDLIMDETGANVTHFVLQEGHLWGKREVALPVSAIDRVEGDTVYVKLDKKAIEKLPTIPRKKEYVEGKEDIELVARVFNDPDKDNEALASEALEFVEDLRRQHVFKILNAAVLVKDQEGEVKITDTREIEPKKGALLGAITGGLIGLLAGPGGAIIGALAGAGAGAAGGKLIDEGFSDKFLKNLQQYLEPGSAALILLVEHHWVHTVEESMNDLGGFVFQETLTDRLVEDLMKSAEGEG
jgi:uncharacterized membrane protein